MNTALASTFSLARSIQPGFDEREIRFLRHSDWTGSEDELPVHE